MKETGGDWRGRDLVDPLGLHSSVRAGWVVPSEGAGSGRNRGSDSAYTGKNSIKYYACQFIYSISFEWSGKVLKRLGIQVLMGGVRGMELCAAKSRTALTCSCVRPSNIFTISSMVRPSSRFSNTAATGMRVPRKTQAPLRFPGTLSTAEHCDQSSGIFSVVSHSTAKVGEPACKTHALLRSSLH
jgi:hypothetical protein